MSDNANLVHIITTREQYLQWLQEGKTHVGSGTATTNEVGAVPYHQSEYMNAKQVMMALNISRTTLLEWRRDGLLPQPVTIRRRIMFRRNEIMALPHLRRTGKTKRYNQSDPFKAVDPHGV